MTYPITFANLAQGNQPLSDFDTMFLQVAAMLAVPVTAAGTNAIIGTPNTNCPALTAYTNLCAFQFLAAANSTGAVTFQQVGLAALPCYRADGTTQIASGDILAGRLYTVVFSGALNTGSGGFYLTQATINPVIAVAGGSFAGLSISNNVGNPNTQMDVSAAEIVMVNPANGSAFNAQFPAFTINTAVVGVNGLDSGVLAASAWYYVWAISNGSTTAGLISLNSTSPVLPGGYVFRKRLGAVRTDITAGQTSTVTISQASPGVVTWNASNLPNGIPVVFSTTGGLPAPLVPGTTYYVVNATANNFSVASTPFATAINTTSAGSGTQTATIPAVRLMRTLQLGRDVQYVIQSAPTPPFIPPLIVSGPGGTYSITSPALVSAAINTVVPPTAAVIKIAAANAWGGFAGGGLLAAPNTNWGTTNTGPQAVGQFVWPVSLIAASVENAWAEMVLESTSTIAWCGSAAGDAISCMGWRDNV